MKGNPREALESSSYHWPIGEVRGKAHTRELVLGIRDTSTSPHDSKASQWLVKIAFKIFLRRWMSDWRSRWWVVGGIWGLQWWEFVFGGCKTFPDLRCKLSLSGVLVVRSMNRMGWLRRKLSEGIQNGDLLKLKMFCCGEVESLSCSRKKTLTAKNRVWVFCFLLFVKLFGWKSEFFFSFWCIFSVKFFWKSSKFWQLSLELLISF